MSKDLFSSGAFRTHFFKRSSRWITRLLYSTLVVFVFFSTANGAGPLRVNPQNPRYFIDTTGQTVYLTGTHVDNNLIDRNDKPTLDFNSYLDVIQQFQHNFVRLWVWEQTAWTHENNANVEFGPHPYKRTGPGNGLDGKPKFDLNQFNQAYFDRLRSRVIAAGQRGVYVSVMLFQGFSSETKTGAGNPWPGHPFHSSNNINGINGDSNGNGRGEEVHSLRVAPITDLQKAYIRKIVDTLNDLDNVLYELSGEAPLSTKQWQYEMIEYLKEYQGTKSKQHPVGISYFYNGRGKELFNSSADWVLFSDTDDNPPMARGNKVVLLDANPETLSSGTAHQWVWKSLMRGYNPVYLESNLFNGNADPRILTSMGWALNIANTAELSSMEPNERVCSTRYCLFDRGSEYLVYAPGGGIVKVNLSGGNRDFLVTWFDPTTGQTISDGTVGGGRLVQLTSPIAGDAVLHLLATDAASFPSNTASGTSGVSQFDFSLSNSGPVSLTQGASAAATIGLDFIAKTSTVKFSVAGLPPGITASFSKGSCTIDCSTVLTFNASASVVSGTYPITITGKSTKGQKTTSFNLAVAASATATVQPPMISPNGGTYTSPVTVTMATATADAAIYYTTDGSTPTSASKRYAGPIMLTASAVVKGKAFKSSSTSSETGASFTVASTIDFSLSNSGNKSVPPGSSVTNSIIASLISSSTQAVSFSASGLPSGTTASFSTTSCSPSCSTVLTIATTGSTPAGNFPITVTATGGGVTKTSTFSLTLAAAITPTVATPTITPNGGSFTNSASVTMSTTTSGASIYYTTNGTSPTQSSTLYTGAVTLTSSAVVKAKAFKTGANASAEANASFNRTTTGTTSSGLVARWKFDESSGMTAADSSGNGNTGTLTNGPVWSAGIVGNALYFDGIDDSVTVPDSNSLDLSNSFTLLAWVKPVSSYSDLRTILRKDENYYLYASSAHYCSGSLAGFGRGNPQDMNLVCDPVPLATNVWTHLAWTYNGSVLTLYKDGIMIVTFNSFASPLPGTGTLQIGGSLYGENFNGFIDEVSIYDRALSNAEIQSVYQQIASTVTPPSGFNYVLSQSGDKSVSAGASVITSISASLTAGSPQSISFSASGLPATATASFSTTSCSPSCATVLTINADSSTPSGSYPISVTASGGGVLRTTIFTLSITSALTVAAPTINPVNGTFSSPVSVSIATATTGASIYYTTDGSTPTQSSIAYSGAMTISNSATVKAKAFKTGYTASNETSASFTIAAATIPTNGNIYYVAKTGSNSYSCSQARSASTPRLTIASGIACLASGDTLIVKAGTYAETIQGTMPSGLSASQHTILMAYPGETVILRPTTTTDAVLWSGGYKQFVTFDGFIVDGIYQTNGFGVFIEDTAPNFTVKNLSVSNVCNSGIYSNGTNSLIQGNTVHNVGRCPYDVTLPGHGIYMKGSNSVVERNNVYNNPGYGIHQYSSSGNSNNVVVRANRSHHNAKHGILIGSGTNNQAYNNLVYANGNSGILIAGTNVSSAKIYNNTSVGNGTCIWIMFGTSHAVRNNICRNNGTGIYEEGGPGNAISNNLTSGDPLFVNEAANDFALRSGSPAINAGMTLSEVPSDFNGVARPKGTAYDIGAFELVP